VELRAERGSAIMSKNEKKSDKMFRFQNLEIWKKAIEIGNKLMDIADDLEQRKLYRFAEQVRGASLSISNNISEGSGSSSKKEFANFLNIAKRSAFENANMAIVFEKRGLITSASKDELLNDLEEECKMISGFIRNLKNK
jgi:four helix bundle protein